MVIVVQDELSVLVSFDHEQVASLALADFLGPCIILMLPVNLVELSGDRIPILVLDRGPVRALGDACQLFFSPKKLANWNS